MKEPPADPEEQHGRDESERDHPGSNTRTIALAGTFTTSRIGRTNVKKRPSGAAQVPLKISLG